MAKYSHDCCRFCFDTDSDEDCLSVGTPVEEDVEEEEIPEEIVEIPNDESLQVFLDMNKDQNEKNTTKTWGVEILPNDDSLFLDMNKDQNKMDITNAWGDDDIFQKIKQAQKIAEDQVQGIIGATVGEISRLRKSHAKEIIQLGKSHSKAKQKLEAKCSKLEQLAQAEWMLKMLAEKEMQKVTNQKLCAEKIANEANRKCADLEQKVTNQKLCAEKIANEANRKCAGLERENARLQENLKRTKIRLGQEIKRITDDKLRAEHIGNETDRQCTLLHRENARLQAELKATRLKFAYIDAQRQDFRLQLTTLRATLGLLSREPACEPILSREPLPSPYVPVHPSRCGPNSKISEDEQSQDPQIQHVVAPVLPNRPASRGSLAADTLRSCPPTWLAICADKEDTTANELRPSNNDLPKPSNHDMSQPSKVDVPQPSNDDMSQPSKVDVPQPSNHDISQPSKVDVPQPSNHDMSQSSKVDVPQTSNHDISQPSKVDVPQSSNDDMSQSSKVDVPQSSNEGVSKSPNKDANKDWGASTSDDGHMASAGSEWDESDFEFSVISTVSDTDASDDDTDSFDFDISEEDEYSYEFENDTALLV